MKQIPKIVITGGPCAGKTTALSWIQNYYTKLGYRTLFIPESATELIGGGVAPWTTGSPMDFQKCITQLQLEKERIFAQAAATMPEEKLLLVCDRGVLDNKAYMSDGEFDEILTALGHSEVELRDNYDAVFHLVSAAKGADRFYTTENNSARTETVEQAAALDDKIIAAWTGHPHLRIIDNATDLHDKLERLVGEISAFLGEPEPYEIERKYLIEYPDTAWLESLPNCERVEIIQTYLKNTTNANAYDKPFRVIYGSKDNFRAGSESRDQIAVLKAFFVEKDQANYLLAKDTLGAMVVAEDYAAVAY